MGNAKRKSESGKASRKKAGAETLSFESALEKLEGSVARLEEGEMPLEEALELFESGVKLSRQCQSTLETAERRVEILVADRELESGGESEVAFEFEEDGDDESEFED